MTSKNFISETITVGDNKTANTNNGGTSISGNFGTSNSGDYGTSISGFEGISTSGYKGTSISGNYGISTNINKGKCKAGHDGIIVIFYHDAEDNNKRKIKTGYIGEDGLEPNVFYKLDENYNFVKCE